MNGIEGLRLMRRKDASTKLPLWEERVEKSDRSVKGVSGQSKSSDLLVNGENISLIFEKSMVV